MDEFINTFVEESGEQITNLNNSLLDLEQSPDDREAMDEIFRAAHTLKGNAGAMGFGEMSDLAHGIEDVLDEIRSGNLEITPEVMDDLFDGVDLFEEMLEEARENGETETDATDTIENLHEYLEEADANADEADTEDTPTDSEPDYSEMDWDELRSTASDRDLFKPGMSREEVIEALQNDTSDSESEEQSPEVDIPDPTDAEREDLLNNLDEPDSPVTTSLYHVRLRVDGDDETGNSEAGVLEGLKDAFDVYGTLPDEDDVQTEEHDSVFDAVIASTIGEDNLKPALNGLPQVHGSVVFDISDELDWATSVTADPDQILADNSDADDLAGDVDTDSAFDDMEVDDLLDEASDFDNIHDIDDDMVSDVEMSDDDLEGESGTFDQGDSEPSDDFDDLDGEFDDIDPDELAEGGTDDEPEVSDDTDVGVDNEGAALFQELTEEEGVEATDDFEEVEEEMEEMDFDFGDAEDEEEEISFDELVSDEFDLEDGGDAGDEDDEIFGEGGDFEEDESPGIFDSDDSTPDSEPASASASDDEDLDNDVNDVFGSGDSDGGDDDVDDLFGSGDSEDDTEDDPFDTDDSEDDSEDVGDETDFGSESGDVDDLLGDEAGDYVLDSDTDETDPEPVSGGVSEEPAEEPASASADSSESDSAGESKDVVGDVLNADDDLDFGSAFDSDDGLDDFDDLLRDSGRSAPEESESSIDINSIRVDVDQLDELYTLVQELVTNRIRLRRAVETAETQTSGELGDDLVQAFNEIDELETITSRMQDTVMNIRLVPLEHATKRLPRIVRDVAREKDKKVNFEIEGEDVELDRGILSKLGDPLMHLVRNAVDHGIESPEERVEAGKPEEGTVRISARRQRDRVSVIVEDDGDGIDADSLRREAVEEGLLTEEQAAQLSDQQAYELIFHPGFSTAEEVTETSGRGVGMDVVYDTIRGIDGSVEVTSEPGKGTKIRLRLPVSLAIMQVMFVDVGGKEFGIPIKNIDEITRVDDLTTIEGQEAHTYDGKTYPLLRLHDELDVDATADAADDNRLVRIDDSIRQVTLLCDGVTRTEEVVVEPYDGVLTRIPGLSGAAVLGEGNVVNILDVETL